MRTVATDISKLGLNVGDTLKIQLLNSVGKPFMTRDGYMLDEEIILSEQILSKELRENDTISSKSFYKITLPNKFTFSFTVKSSDILIPLDLIGIMRVGCFDGIVDASNNTKKLSDDFIRKLNLYFTGENPFFTNTEKSLVDLYEYYADEIIGTDSTIDIVQMMDEYLATILPKEEK